MHPSALVSIKWCFREAQLHGVVLCLADGKHEARWKCARYDGVECNTGLGCEEEAGTRSRVWVSYRRPNTFAAFLAEFGVVPGTTPPLFLCS